MEAAIAGPTADPGYLPAKFTVDDMNLTPEEVATYPRWYTDLLLRKRTPTIGASDVLAYITNFGLSQDDKSKISAMFPPHLSTVDPQIFYACLRLVSHAKTGLQPSYALIFQPAPVPKPRSIVSKTKKQDPADSPQELQQNQHEPLQAQPTGGNPFRKPSIMPAPSSAENPKFDINSFTSFMLTGERPAAPASPVQSSPRPKKHVTFDTGPPQVAEAAARSMEELLRQARNNMPRLLPKNAPPRPSPLSASTSANYDVGDIFNIKTPLVAQNTGGIDEDVEIDRTHFKNIQIDTVLHNGVSNLPSAPAVNMPNFPFPGFAPNSDSPSPSPPVGDIRNGSIAVPAPPLPPKVRTASTAGIDIHNMNSYTQQPLIPNSTGPAPLNPTHTGSSFHHTGVTLPTLQSNPTGTISNIQSNHTGSLPSLQPSHTGSISGLQPNHTGSLPSLQPTLTGSVSNAPPVVPQPRKVSTPLFGLSPQATGQPTLPIQSQITGSSSSSSFSQQRNGSLAIGPLQAHPTGGNNDSILQPQQQQQKQSQNQLNSNLGANNQVVFNPLYSQPTYSNSGSNLHQPPFSSSTASPRTHSAIPQTLDDFKSIFHGPGAPPKPPVPSHNSSSSSSSSFLSVPQQRSQTGSTSPIPYLMASQNGSNSSLEHNQPSGTPAPPTSRFRSFSGSTVSSLSPGGSVSSSQPVMSNGLLMPPPPPPRRRPGPLGSTVEVNGSISGNLPSPSSSMSQFPSYENNQQFNRQLSQAQGTGSVAPPLPPQIPLGVPIHPSASMTNLQQHLQQQQPQQQQHLYAPALPPHMQTQLYNDAGRSNSVPNLVSGMQKMSINSTSGSSSILGPYGTPSQAPQQQPMTNMSQMGMTQQYAPSPLAINQQAGQMYGGQYMMKSSSDGSQNGMDIATKYFQGR